MAEPPIARRMSDIQPFYVMDLLARARTLEGQGRSIIHMEVGEPDFPSPEPIVAAGREALARGRHHYTPAVGLPELRRAIARHYAVDHGVEVAPDRIVITPGASGALLLLMGVLVDRDRTILMADPGYPSNRHFVRMCEGAALMLPVGADTDFQPSPGQVRAAWDARTAGVLIGSPANPTGTLIGAAALDGIVAVARERGGAVIVDEIYQGLSYGAAIGTALTRADDCFIVNSFSKYYGMTGWRLGWLVAPEPYVRSIEKLAQNIFLAAATPAQHAALAAFAPETRAITEARRREFGERRDFLVPALRRLGFGVPVTPEGAFYVYADCSAFTADSFGFAQRLLEEAGVAVTPGRDFGFHRAERYLRFAYTTSLAHLEEGVRRLDWFLTPLR